MAEVREPEPVFQPSPEPAFEAEPEAFDDGEPELVLTESEPAAVTATLYEPELAEEFAASPEPEPSTVMTSEHRIHARAWNR